MSPWMQRDSLNLQSSMLAGNRSSGSRPMPKRPDVVSLALLRGCEPERCNAQSGAGEPWHCAGQAPSLDVITAGWKAQAAVHMKEKVRAPSRSGTWVPGWPDVHPTDVPEAGGTVDQETRAWPAPARFSGPAVDRDHLTSAVRQCCCYQPSADHLASSACLGGAQSQAPHGADHSPCARRRPALRPGWAALQAHLCRRGLPACCAPAPAHTPAPGPPSPGPAWAPHCTAAEG